MIFIIDTLTDASWASAPIVGGGPYGDSTYVRCSLRYFITATNSPRIGLIATTGVTSAATVLNADFGSWSLYGQTSGGKFILKKNGINIRQGSDNVVLMHFNSFTDSTLNECEVEGLQLVIESSGTTDLVRIIIDHYSGLWGTDSNFDIRNQNPDLRKIDSVFVYQSLFAQPLKVISDYGCNNHSYNVACGLSYAFGESIDPAKAIKSIVYFQNALAHSVARNPLANGDISWVNNIVYNPVSRATYLRNEGVTDGGGGWATQPLSSNFNFVNNTYQKGRATAAGTYPIRFGESSTDTLGATAQVYISGNVDDFSPVPVYTDSSHIDHIASTARSSIDTYNLPVIGTDHLYDFLLPKVGASPLNRTTQETNIVNDIRDSTGTASTDGTGIVNTVDGPSDVSVTGGYPLIVGVKNTFTFPANPNTLAANVLTNLENWIHTNFTLKVESTHDKALILDTD